MARGWESKSIEEQQAEAGVKSSAHGKRMTAQEASVFREKENLRLARQRVLDQMAKISNPRHRKVMEDALADLNQKLAKL